MINSLKMDVFLAKIAIFVEKMSKLRENLPKNPNKLLKLSVKIVNHLKLTGF